MNSLAQDAIVVGGFAFVFLVLCVGLLISDDKLTIPFTSHSRLLAAEHDLRIADLRFKQAQIDLNAFELEQQRYDRALGTGAK